MTDEDKVSMSIIGSDGEVAAEFDSVEEFADAAKKAAAGFPSSLPYGEQLTFDITAPKIDGTKFKKPSIATLAIGGAVVVDQDVNPDDKLRVVVTNADGQVIGQAEVTVGGVTFKPIYADKMIVGVERIQKGKVTAE